MFGMSLGELLIIFVVAFLVFGPERLPHIAAKIGKIAAEMKKTSDSFRKEFYNAVYTPTDEVKTLEKDLSRLVSSDPHIQKPLASSPAKKEQQTDEPAK